MYKTIFVAIDDSELSRSALQEAATVAKAHGAKLLVSHVADEALLTIHKSVLSSDGGFEKARHALLEGGAKLLAEAKQALAGQIDAEVKLLETGSQRISEVVVEGAKAAGADLIVMGTHGRRGLSKLVLGSVAEQVVRAAQCSVLLVRKH